MLVILASAGTGFATTLQLPASNVMTTGSYGDFLVYSLELNDKCGAAGDPRCFPYIASQYPVDSSPGQINSQLVIYMGSNGNDNTPTPFPAVPTALYDNPFRSPAGNATTFDMSSANEPGAGNVVNASPEFTGDKIGTWQVRISDLLVYLTSGGKTHDLVFLFDNNQQGNLTSQFLGAWGQVQITDSTGAQVGANCWELNFTGPGCGTTSPTSTVPPFVPVIGDFCVDKSTGASYRTGPTGDGATASNAGDCSAANNPTHPAGGYFITNNLGQNSGEFAIINAVLNAAVKDPSNASNFLTVNLKLRFLNDGDEQLWICSACDFTNVPEPATTTALGLGLVAMSVVVWRRRRR